MKRDSRLSSVLHVLLHMAEHDGLMTSEVLARCLGTNPVVVRRTMGLPREAGVGAGAAPPAPPPGPAPAGRLPAGARPGARGATPVGARRRGGRRRGAAMGGAGR